MTEPRTPWPRTYCGDHGDAHRWTEVSTAEDEADGVNVWRCVWCDEGPRVTRHIHGVPKDDESNRAETEAEARALARRGAAP